MSFQKGGCVNRLREPLSQAVRFGLMSDFDYDCLVIGGGPAGLTAAIYLVRYHLSLKVIDAGQSRAATIPCSHNHAGYPGGINGKELVEKMREQAQMYGATIETGRVTRLDVIEGGFQAEWGAGCVTARKVLLATGVTNRKPPMDPELHDAALAQGLIRYCPVCDGYEVTDKKVGVIGSGSHGVAEAVFIRGFTEDITLIAPDRAHDLSEEDRARLEEFGILAVDGPCEAVAAQGKCITSRRLTASMCSTASTRRWAPTPMSSSPGRSEPNSPPTTRWPLTITSAPTFRDFTQPAMS
jgi:thioredoxin reductase (NADPH)